MYGYQYCNQRIGNHKTGFGLGKLDITNAINSWDELFQIFSHFFMCFAFEKWTILWHPDKYCCFLLHAYHMFWGQESRLNGEKG